MFRALGALAVLDHGADVVIGGPRQRRLLAMLLVHRNSVVSTDRLADVVFEGRPTDAAATTIRSYIARLRRVVETGDQPLQVVTQAPGYRLDVPDDLVDTACFERLVEHARTVLLADPGAASSIARRALGLWAGDAYAEFADEEWAYGEAQRLEELRLAAYELLFEAELASGRHAELAAEIEPIARRHRLRETLQAHLMTSLYRSGRQADALRVFQEHRRALVEELGLEPSGALQTLERRILQQDRQLLDVRPTERSVRAYRLGERLGVGPDSVLYAARLPGIERPLVVRAFRAEIADEPVFVREFDADARRVAALRHPAIVPIHDHWREPGAAYLVSTRLPGGSLADRLGHGPLTPPEVEALVRRIGGALATAADAGVVHGRVGASNVLYDEAGQPHLTDFQIGVGPVRHRLDDDRRAFCTLVGLCAPATDLPPLTGASWSEVVSGLLSGLDIDRTGVADAPADNPYKGLFAFDESDADDFFGRSEVVDDVVGRLRRDDLLGRLVLVVGGSGTGKSSVARAGILPRIRRGDVAGSEGWFVTSMLPGASPFESLAEALRRVAVGSHAVDGGALRRSTGELDRALRTIVPDGEQLVLLVDQFEELFTLTAPEDVAPFLGALVDAVTADDGRLRVLATLRADYFGHPLTVPGFGSMVQDATVTLPAMTAADLEAAVVGPAERVGRSVEWPLVADLVANVTERPAALPALQFALYQLASTTTGTLTLAGYRELGGITGAIATRAETLYRDLDDLDRHALRQMFERLTVVGPDTEPTRRAAERSELTGDPPDPRLDALVGRWVSARLLTADRHPRSRVPTVEVAHEALLREWPRLREWLDDDRDDLIVLANLRHAAAAWLELERDDGALYRGARLEVAIEVTATHGSITAAEREFLDASRATRDAEAEAEAARVVRQARTNRRLRAQLAVIAVALVAALAGGFVAVDQRQDAEQERRIATARELASAATANLEADPDRSALLALAAVDTTARHGDPAIPEAVQALHAAVSSHRLLLDVPGVGGALDWSPRGDVFVTEGPEESGAVDIRDAVTGVSLHLVTGHEPDVNDVKFSADGSMLATTGDDGALRIWDPATGRQIRAFEYEPVAVWAPSFSPDGTKVVAEWFLDDRPVFRVLDLETGTLLLERDSAPALATSWRPDGERVAVADNGAEDVDVVDPSTGDVVTTIATGQLWVKDVAYSPDGQWLATAGGDATVRLWDATTGAPAVTITAHEGAMNGIDWNTDGSLLATASADGTAKVIEIADGGWRERTSVAAQSLNGGVADVAFSPDGTRIMTGDFAIESVKIWDISPTAGGEVFTAFGVPFVTNPVVWTADDRILSSSAGGGVSVWDGADGRLLDTIGPLVDPGEEVGRFAVSPDGRLIATTIDFLPISIWDLSTGLLVGEVGADDEGAFVFDLAWDPAGGRIAVLVGHEQAGQLVVANPTGDVVERFDAEPGLYMRSVRFDVTGERVITTASDLRDGPASQGTIVWHLTSGEVVRDTSLPAVGLAVDPNGRLWATSRPLDGVADVWDATTGEHLTSLNAAALVEDVQFSPDGHRVATASPDGTVRVWDPIAGTQEVVLTHDDQVSSIAFSPDGSRIASLTYDGVIRVWTLDLDELVGIARGRVTRALADDECRQYLHVDRCPDA